MNGFLISLFSRSMVPLFRFRDRISCNIFCVAEVAGDRELNYGSACRVIDRNGNRQPSDTQGQATFPRIACLTLRRACTNSRLTGLMCMLPPLRPPSPLPRWMLERWVICTLFILLFSACEMICKYSSTFSTSELVMFMLSSWLFQTAPMIFICM